MFRPKYFYHLTCIENAVSILTDKYLTYGKGEEKWNENFISFADYLHFDLATFDFGDLCFEFKAKNLLQKNQIYPYDFQITDNKYFDSEGNLLYGMWECEWVSKKTVFDFDDINCFIVSTDAKKALRKTEWNNLKTLLVKNNIPFKFINFTTLPKPDNNFLLERYLLRIKN